MFMLVSIEDICVYIASMEDICVYIGLDRGYLCLYWYRFILLSIHK